MRGALRRFHVRWGPEGIWPLLFSVIAGVFLFSYFLFFLYRSLVIAQYQFTVDYVEAYVLAQTRILAQAGNPYTDVNSVPYLGAVYAPVYMVVLAFLGQMVAPTYAEGRFLTLIAALSIGALIYLVVKRETNNPKISFVSALFFFASHYVYTWSPYYRTDFLGILFALAGMSIVHRYGSSTRLYLVIPLFVLAFFTKQTLVDAPIAALAYLLSKDFRLARRFAINLLLAVVGLLLAANYLTEGQYFLHAFTFHQVNPFALGHALPFLYEMATMFPILLAFSAWSLLRRFTKEQSLFVYWFVAALFVTFSGASKEGAWINYWIELYAVVCILFGLSWHALQRRAIHQTDWLLPSFLSRKIGKGHSLFVCCLVAALLVALYRASREDAWIVFWLELFMVVSVIFSLSWRCLRRKGNYPSEGLFPTFLSLTVLIQVIILFHAPFLSSTSLLPVAIREHSFFDYQFYDPPTDADRAENALVLEYARTSPGKVLSLDGFFFPSDELGIELGPDPFVYPYLEAAGLWNSLLFKERIRRKEFSMIVSWGNATRYGYNIDSYYDSVHQTEHFSVYHPR